MIFSFFDNLLSVSTKYFVMDVKLKVVTYYNIFVIEVLN